MPSQDQTEVHVGKAVAGQYRLTAGNLLHQSSGPKGWKVNALTAGNFAGDEADELVVAAVVDGVQQVTRGDGRTAQSGEAMPGVSGSQLYSSPKARVIALTHGIFANGHESLVTALHALAADAPQNAVYVGDGVTTAAAQQIFDAKSSTVQALAVARLGTQGARLLTVLDESGTTRVYAGALGNPAAKQLYDVATWRVTALSAAQLDSDADDELVTGFDQPDKTQVRWGNGTKGLDDGGVIYSFP